MGKEARKSEYELKLYVSGAAPNSVRAINNLQEILEAHLPGRYNLSIIDVRQEPTVAQREQIVALPMLVKEQPSPKRSMIGDMSNTGKVLSGLGIENE